VSTELRRLRQIAAVAAAVLFSLGLAIFGLAAAGCDSVAQSAQAAKKDYALIYGTVWGPSDHPVAGVPIKIWRAGDKKAKWDLISDRNGEFAQRVPVGAQDYVVEAEVKTPKGQAKPQATVHIDDNERKDVGIHLAQDMLSTK
jgi:hypothetical protein